MASSTALEPLNIVPRHVAIIMDGNGRWATSRGLPRLAGQHPRYIEDQLKQFNRRERTNDNAVMHTVASKLTELEAHAVAEYIATLD